MISGRYSEAIDRAFLSRCKYYGFSTTRGKLWGRPDCYPTVTPQEEKVLSAIREQTLSTKEIMGIIGLKDNSCLGELYLYPAIRRHLVEPIYPENPKHPRQRYRLTDNGKKLLKQ